MLHLFAGRRAWLLGLILLTPASLRAEDKGPVERTTNDRQIIDTLRAIHDRGATLYNNGDYAGCARLFEGSLLTVRMLLPKELQSYLDTEMPAAMRQPDAARGAMALHDVIEGIRQKLRDTAGPGATPLGPPRPLPTGTKDKDPSKPADPPKVPGKAAEPGKQPVIEFGSKDPPKIDNPGPKFPTLGTPTKAAPPSETPEPALISPKGDPVPIPMPPPITIPMDDAKPVPAPPTPPKTDPKPPVVPMIEIPIPIPDKK